MNRRTGHTDWCARDHRCNLGEHRSDEIVVNLPGHGRAVLTRVVAANGRQHAEIRLRVALAPAEPAARRQLLGLLADVRDTVTRALAAGRPAPRRAG
ncbi:hypothetical protein M8I35_22245 [Micromonospora sp. MSM11]|nr:hypothetical protein [Micromonospora sp. MSM11]MCL7459900.1 hypothetical protein [Micromonospora sp. MSM11]